VWNKIRVNNSLAGKQTVAGSYSYWQKIKLFGLQYFGYLLIWTAGGTLRFKTEGLDHWIFLKSKRTPMIMVFWHGRIIPTAWYFRKNGIVVMTSLNFDGEYSARFGRMHGYEVVRGSNSRGGLRALAELVRAVKQGKDAGFTVDGPRGPRYQAKIGPILLAKNTGAPILCFHISCRWRIQLNSWDLFQIPIPFSRAKLLIAPPIWIPMDADESVQRKKHLEMQEVLNDLRERGDGYWSKKEGGIY
jgi:lysophospholipid acyltransferase (LPLAT)-like uncharacterized protein